jgi:exopolyphosphatase
VAFDEASGRALAASACTLVVEHWVRQARQAPAGTGPACDQEDAAGASHTELPLLPASLSILLLGTILLDSVNQDPRAGKVTDRDRDAVRALLSRTDWSQLSEEARAALGAGASVAPPDPSALFDALQSSKFDAGFWASLSVRDALRLDYKQFRAGTSTDGPVGRQLVLGMSTVLLSVRDFVSKVNFLEEVGKYMRLHGLDVLVVTMATSSTSEDAGSANLQRQLILCDLEGGSLVRGLVEHLFRPEVQPDLQLAVITGTITSDSASGSGNLYFRAFDQGNAKASRKAVAPLVIDYFASSRI